MFAAAGERFFPVFPLAGTVYVPVFFPAFQPDQYICKEEEEGSPMSKKLKSLHNVASLETIEAPVQSSDTNYQENVLFHMAHRELYKSVAASGEVYFPPTLRLTVCSHMPQLFQRVSSQQPTISILAQKGNRYAYN